MTETDRVWPQAWLGASIKGSGLPRTCELGDLLEKESHHPRRQTKVLSKDNIVVGG